MTEGARLFRADEMKEKLCGLYPMMRCGGDQCLNFQYIDTDRGFCWALVNIRGDRQRYPVNVP